MARGQTPPHQVRVITRVVLTQKTNVGIQASEPTYASNGAAGIVEGGALIMGSIQAIEQAAAPAFRPDFVVSPDGTVFPVPGGAQGPVPVINRQGNRTGTAYTGGCGGDNGKVDTVRMMDPTPPRGKSPGYPNGYIKYENARGQGVDPYTGKTTSHPESHYPTD